MGNVSVHCHWPEPSQDAVLLGAGLSAGERLTQFRLVRVDNGGVGRHRRSLRRQRVEGVATDAATPVEELWSGSGAI